MAGIQLSGLVSGAAFDWKAVVDQLIEVDGRPINTLTNEKVKNGQKINSLDGLKTALTSLQTAAKALNSDDLFSGRTVTSDVANTTWRAIGTTAAPIGSYKFTVGQLATVARLPGTADIGSGLNATNNVSALTVANLTTATAVTAGTFTVNGKQVSVATTDSLADVFGAISTATGGDVTASYSAATDKVTLSNSAGELVLGASNDSSNFLSVFKLANNGTGTATSSGGLGALKASSPLASSGLRTAITGVDGSGNGSFKVNGVSIAYNVNTDALSTVLSRVNQSTAGVTASYDSAADRVVFVSKKTGDIGMTVSDTTGNLLGALGVSGASLVHGQNAEFSVDDGPTLTSTTNTFDASSHGIAGLSVSATTESTQTINVASDSSSMQGAIQSFVDAFNSVHSYIDDATKITSKAGKVTTSVLSNNREVQDWSRRLRSMAFDALSGVSGSVKRLDHLGIDFDGTTGELKIKDSAKLANALNNTPEDVAQFFQSGTSGFVSKINTYLTGIIKQDDDQQTSLNKASDKLDDQMAVLRRRLDDERALLTSAFIAMQDAQSQANSQQQTITSAFFSKNG